MATDARVGLTMMDIGPQAIKEIVAVGEQVLEKNHGVLTAETLLEEVRETTVGKEYGQREIEAALRTGALEGHYILADGVYELL